MADEVYEIYHNGKVNNVSGPIGVTLPDSEYPIPTDSERIDALEEAIRKGMSL